MALLNNPFKPILKQIPAPFKNKYFVTLVLFFIWMIFFEKRDFLTIYKLQQSIHKMEQDKTYYENQIVEAKKDQLDILNNKEKYAREHYYMKKNDEDVFIIVEEPAKNY